MKKHFAPPEFKMALTAKPDGGRQIIKIEGREFVVPNTFEPERWQQIKEARKKEDTQVKFVPV